MLNSGGELDSVLSCACKEDSDVRSGRPGRYDLTTERKRLLSSEGGLDSIFSSKRGEGSSEARGVLNCSVLICVGVRGMLMAEEAGVDGGGDDAGAIVLLG